MLGRVGREGISAPKAAGTCAFCLWLCRPICVLIPAGVWVLPGGTNEKEEITEHQNKELLNDSGLRRTIFARQNVMAFLDGARKQGCSHHHSSFHRIACINPEIQAQPAPASRSRTWQEHFAKEARAVVAVGSLAGGGSSLIRSRELLAWGGQYW